MNMAMNMAMNMIMSMRKKRMGDIRGIPTPICPYCESTLINITASFNPENYEIEMYLLDNASCADCGALLTAPTPADLPA
jgi:hypothetical protein